MNALQPVVTLLVNPTSKGVGKAVDVGVAATTRPLDEDVDASVEVDEVFTAAEEEAGVEAAFRRLRSSANGSRFQSLGIGGGR